jgi:histidinol-phosphate aminotransferase
VPGDVKAVNQSLLEQGVIVRPIGIYEMPQHLRVTIGLESENSKFLKSLEIALGKLAGNISLASTQHASEASTTTAEMATGESA